MTRIIINYQIINVIKTIKYYSNTLFGPLPIIVDGTIILLKRNIPSFIINGANISSLSGSIVL